MTFEEISKIAYSGEELPSNSNLAVKYAYSEMKLLYKDYSNGNINLEKSIELKNKIKSEYENNLREIEEYYRIMKTYNDDRIKYETYLCSIEKSQNQDDLLDNALKLIEVIIKDKNFIERAEGKK